MMDRAVQDLAARREATTPPCLQSKSDYTSDSDEDPNVEESESRPRREASKRARVVIANACGVRNTARPTETPSPKNIKKELADDSGPISVEDFFEQLEEDLRHTVKVEANRAVVRKLKDEPDLTDESLFSLGFGTPSNNVVPSPASTLASAKKRPREVFDCVLLTSRKPTPPKRRRIGSPENTIVKVEDLTKSDCEESSDEEKIFKEKMKAWKNDKVKKLETLRLRPETLRARIQPIGFDIQDQFITVDKLTQEHMITRKFMSKTYGGSTQEVEPKIGEDYQDDHDMRDFFYLNTDFQPEAPEIPGAPGLWFCTDPGPDKGVRRVITKIQDKTAKNNDKWLYVGQYEILAVNPLTVEEWEAQSTTFRNKWADAVVTHGWGADLRARVYGRQLYKRDPTQSERKHIKDSRSFRNITQKDVKEAFSSGQERMGIWTMKCVGYDNDFQQEISQRFTPNWRPRTKEKKQVQVKRQKDKTGLKAKKEEKRIKLEFD